MLYNIFAFRLVAFSPRWFLTPSNVRMHVCYALALEHSLPTMLFIDDKAFKLGQAIGENVCGVILESLETGERRLGMHVVRHLADQWPLAAATACILRPQYSKFRPKLLQYALSATRSYGVRRLSINTTTPRCC